MTDARRGLTIFFLLGAAALLLLLLGGLRRTSPIESAIGSATLPVQRVLSPVAEGARDLFSGLTYGPRARSENERLRREVERLTAENVRLLQLQYENDQLQSRLGFTGRRPDLKLLSARVVGRDPASLRQHLVLDEGSDRGVTPGIAVTDPSGALIGRVQSVERDRSTVLLITDTESSVNASIERSRATGILEGRWQKGSFLTMRYIEQGLTPLGQPRVRAGDWVVTSALGGNLPNGLLLGRVHKVRQADTGLEQQAEVLPAVDVRSVESVLLVVGH